ncbi:hypothetical protein COV04_01795 [Candidatus Uhrbacteria bacterium CG10_big_fil_rev_8_21_14_0_10_48_11]|uniref:Uncharacterized protein n=1 Tax=Candidatus Uhrbacteria bacterium CG10_big_fil_rev_8_21_14_0_10_48_11 TaxID=1975037 RepID=A0A2M8LF92_9BACT|nr:MAG: hypothetical protein COV04_01795 [Candidatus Uhrbacteria bacterium CG10_big_fil_rev_8_21_14_0_10_48_11]
MMKEGNIKENPTRFPSVVGLSHKAGMVISKASSPESHFFSRTTNELGSLWKQREQATSSCTGKELFE